jgi:hypothetical protein
MQALLRINQHHPLTARESFVKDFTNNKESFFCSFVVCCVRVCACTRIKKTPTH